MKIVIDSNVLIAAFAARGLCHEVLEYCLYEHELFLSNYIVEECKTKFKTKIKLPNNQINKNIEFLTREAMIIEPVTVSPSICRDKKDLEIIGTAIACNADILVSGDRDILTLKEYEQTQFLSPRELWDYVKEI